MEIYIDTVGTCTVYAFVQHGHGGAAVLLTRVNGEEVCWLVEPTAGTLADGRRVYHAYWGNYGPRALPSFVERTSTVLAPATV